MEVTLEYIKALKTAYLHPTSGRPDRNKDNTLIEKEIADAYSSLGYPMSNVTKMCSCRKLHHNMLLFMERQLK